MTIGKLNKFSTLLVFRTKWSRNRLLNVLRCFYFVPNIETNNQNQPVCLSLYN